MGPGIEAGGLRMGFALGVQNSHCFGWVGNTWSYLRDLPDPGAPMLCSSVLSHSVMSNSFFATTWPLARQAPLSMRILQTGILEWIAMPSSRGSSQPRDWIQVSRIRGEFFTIWVTREAPEAPIGGHDSYHRFPPSAAKLFGKACLIGATY